MNSTGGNRREKHVADVRKDQRVKIKEGGRRDARTVEAGADVLGGLGGPGKKDQSSGYRNGERRGGGDHLN